MNKGIIQGRIDKRTTKLENGCMEWWGAKDRDGYGAMGFMEDGQKRWFRVHRVAYEIANGQIPDGLVIDHLCRNRACVNPAHMEPVTLQENLRRGTIGAVNGRKTACPKGHEYSALNTYVSKLGKRSCRTCLRERMRERKKCSTGSSQ